MSEIELCRKIWGRIYNPKSAVPDVEIGHVLEVMVDALVAEGWSGGGITPTEVWGLAYIAILGKATYFDVAMSWSDRVPSYKEERDANGMSIPLDIDIYDREVMLAQGNMKEALTNLVRRGVLEEVTSEGTKSLMLVL